MQSNQCRRDLFSRLVNWLSNAGEDKPAIVRRNGNADLFSRLMNRISG
jgi:hypothetical protein